MTDSRQTSDVYDWSRLPSRSVFVLNGIVINADSYLISFNQTTGSSPTMEEVSGIVETNNNVNGNGTTAADALDRIVRKAISEARSGRKDATKTFARDPRVQPFVKCIQAKYKVRTSNWV